MGSLGTFVNSIIEFMKVALTPAPDEFILPKLEKWER